MTTAQSIYRDHRPTLLDEYDRQTIATIDTLIATGRAAWVLDPDADRVIGLMPTDGSRDALAILWLDDVELETGSALERLAYTLNPEPFGTER